MKKTLIVMIVFLSIISIANFVEADQLQMDNEWETGIAVSDIERDSYQNYYCVSYSYLKKFDKDHNLIYSKDYNSILNCYVAFNSISIDNDNNIYILADCEGNDFFDFENNITRPGNKLLQSNILKLDSDGNILFKINLNVDKDFDYLRGIRVYNDNIYIVGYRYLYRNFSRTEGIKNYYNYEIKAYLIKMDLSGNVLSEVALGERTKQQEVQFFNDTSSNFGTGYASQPDKDTTILIKDDKIYVYKVTDGEIFLGLYSTDLEKIKYEEFGSNSGIRDIAENHDGTYLAVGTIDISLLNPEQPSKRCPCIINYSADGDIISYKTIEGKGTFISIKDKDDGYYGLIYFSEKNVNEYNNESIGYYIVRYDRDFNVQDLSKLTGTGINLFDFDETGISVINGGKISYFNTNFDYKVNINNPENGGKITLQEDREYYPNEEVALKLQENEGYKLKEIQVIDKDGNRIDVNDNNTFIMPASEVTITPIFKKLNNKIIVVSKDETEDVKFEIADITEVEDGTLVKMYITAVLGYEIENLEIVDADKNQIDYTETGTNEYTFIMPDSDVTITPNYRAIMNSEDDKEKEDDKDEGIVETIKTEVTNLYERITNPSTGDKAFELAFAGVAGIIVLLIVKAKRKKSSTRKSNILY